MSRALIVQLARLGDLLQTVPAITALKESEPDLALDLLCPAALAPIARLIPHVDRVVEWDGAQWRKQAEATESGLQLEQIAAADRQLRAASATGYGRVYVLNQHSRALLLGALLGKETIGPRFDQFDEHLTPWAAYIRRVAQTGISHRVHLADVFCGLCRVRPTGRAITIRRPGDRLPADLADIEGGKGRWLGLIVGAGDPVRVVPIAEWQKLITRYVKLVPNGCVALLGDAQECERARAIEEGLPSVVQGRLWNVAGRTTLTELAAVLGRCHRVVGADTGPLHLAAAVGTPVVGWYFARARVHETGPYGAGHVVWQAESVKREPSGVTRQGVGSESLAPSGAYHPAPLSWPIDATVTALAGQPAQAVEDWSIWHSRCDRWGAYFSQPTERSSAPIERERTWQLLHPVRQ